MDVKFVTTTSVKLETVPIVAGQIIALSDKPGYYYDMYVDNDITKDLVRYFVGGSISSESEGTGSIPFVEIVDGREVEY